MWNCLRNLYSARVILILFLRSREALFPPRAPHLQQNIPGRLPSALFYLHGQYRSALYIYRSSVFVLSALFTLSFFFSVWYLLHLTRAGSRVTPWKEKWAKEVFFGMNVLHESVGELRVGDEVDALRVASEASAKKTQ